MRTLDHDLRIFNERLWNLISDLSTQHCTPTAHNILMNVCGAHLRHFEDVSEILMKASELNSELVRYITVNQMVEKK